MKEQPRILMLDDVNRLLINSSSLENLISYEEDLKRLFTIYMAENYER